VSAGRKRVPLLVGLGIAATAAAVLLIGQAVRYTELLRQLRTAAAG
jgi:hypothetical protein